ncbi:MAG: 30S ribosome-binding factor RbfA [Bdellovibrionota bacterium]
MAERRRVFKVSERIREIVAGVLPRAADPRFSMVTITGVVVSPDLREAKLYWSAPDAKDNLLEMEKAFRNATGFFRRAVGDNLDLRFVPNLRFIYDDTLDVYAQVQELIAKIPPEDLAPKDAVTHSEEQDAEDGDD